KVTSYSYAYHKNYGSSQRNKREDKVKNVSVSSDGKTISVELDQLREGYVYQFDFDKFKSASGEELMNGTVCYTLNQTIK
ncbi:MAG: hypothetical protein NE327_16985, partial [Lentisphaeraceae bacterium]|nr:hypothetical protein [Lentisphaeraceae bacterium]